MVLHPFLLVVGLLLAGDIAISRVHYQYKVRETVTRPKQAAVKLLQNTTASAETEICKLAEKLSEARGKALESARWWHPAGQYGAELFDFYRGNNVTKRRTELAKKTCRELVHSADKINRDVNVVAGCAGALALTFLALLMRRSSPRPKPEWPAEWKRKLQLTRPEAVAEFEAGRSAAPSRRTPYKAADSFTETFTPQAEDFTQSSVQASDFEAPPVVLTAGSRTQSSGGYIETFGAPSASAPQQVTRAQKNTFSFQQSEQKSCPSAAPQSSYHSSFADLYTLAPSAHAVPKSAFSDTYSSAAPHSETDEAEEVLAPKVTKRRASGVFKDLPLSEGAEGHPKTPRRSSSKPNLNIDPNQTEWSPLTVESLVKNGAKTPTQMIGGLDVGAIVKTPRRRSAVTALGVAPSIKKTKSES